MKVVYVVLHFVKNILLFSVKKKRTLSPVGERPFKCSFCPKAFKQSSDLRKHENLHTGATRYCCEKCGVDFKRCDALKKHALLHPNGEVSVLKCEKCQSLFATSGGQSSHVCHSKSK